MQVNLPFPWMVMGTIGPWSLHLHHQQHSPILNPAMFTGSFVYIGLSGIRSRFSRFLFASQVQRSEAVSPHQHRTFCSFDPMQNYAKTTRNKLVDCPAPKSGVYFFELLAWLVGQKSVKLKNLRPQHIRLGNPFVKPLGSKKFPSKKSEGPDLGSSEGGQNILVFFGFNSPVWSIPGPLPGLGMSKGQSNSQAMEEPQGVTTIALLLLKSWNPSSQPPPVSLSHFGPWNKENWILFSLRNM